RNASSAEEAFRCTTRIAEEADARSAALWVQPGTDAFLLRRGMTKNLPLLVRVPSEADGVYKAILAIEIPDGEPIEVPVELTVGGGKQ
ncbi:MAG: hypothetical protein U9R68_07730, partial [Planctomycetota bacterium]|nr:hypothetical protein [Planctomycetota bacterium]